MQNINLHLSKKNYNKNSDGEINITQDVMHTVSPYSNDFKDVLEKDISQLVTNLNKKGWLTVSSCDGHKGKKIWYLTVCVKDKNDYDIFQNIVRHRYLWYTQHYFVPTLVDVNANKGMHFEKTDPKPNQVTNYLNSIFLRDYDKWFVFSLYLNFQENLDPEYDKKDNFSNNIYYVKKQFWYWFKFKQALKTITQLSEGLPLYDK
jgi:hypothetical protein